jgi:hypothetical protein
VRLIRAAAVLGFVIGFALVLALPLALIDAMLQPGEPASFPTLTTKDVRLLAGIIGIGVLFALFSVALWLVADADAK